MYLEHYGLKTKPFQISADPRFLWLGSKHKEALAILKYGIFDNRGFLLLSGDVGTGKTTLIHALIRDIGDDTVVATVPDPGLTLLDFYRYIARAFGIKKAFETKEQFLEVFERFLLKNEAQKKKVLLIIDESQRLTSELLEEIRLLSNIEKDYTKLLNIFFVGQNEFNDIILKQKNRPLRQRITINYNIDPLEQHEVMEYINFRLNVAGCKDPLFTGDAVREVFTFSEGYPRLINIICDHALLTGFVQGVARVTGNIVGECADELRIQSVKAVHAPPPPEPDLLSLQTVPSPTVYPAPIKGFDRDKGLSSTQTMLVAIIGILCFVAGLLVFSLRDRAGDAEVAATTPTGEVASVVEQTTQETETKAAPAKQGLAEPPEVQPASGSIRDASAEPPSAGQKTSEAPWMSSSTDQAVSPKPTAETRTPVVAAVDPAPRQQQGIDQSGNISLKDLMADPGALTLNFQIDSNELTAEDIRDLDRIAAVLNNRTDIQAKITGYTDAVGNLRYNLKVSEFRANIVKIYLVGKGVAADRISSVGMGPANPIATNETLEGRRRNRRVEIELETGPTAAPPS